jgi:peptidyl-tRNA hydrolase, PTH1 family
MRRLPMVTPRSDAGPSYRARLSARDGLAERDRDAWLVIGLGNPGIAYSRHRHNVGYAVTDVLAARMGGRLRAHKSRRADIWEGRLPADSGPADSYPRIVLGRSRSFMNESGGAVATLVEFYKISLERLVVVHDELDIPFPTLRVKLGGGDNGHNGVRSIRAALGSGDFIRVRVGIGRPATRQAVSDFVLSPYSATERAELPSQLDQAADAVVSLVTRGLVATQNAIN